MLVSIVVPAFNEEKNLIEMYEKTKETMESIDYSWELIFVDDGSTDSTWQEIARLHGIDQRVNGIRLSRNFGHQYALMAGIRSARGLAVITADADLQHPPSVFPKLIDEWRNGSKIVQTVRLADNNLGFFKRFTSRQFYRLFRILSGVNLEAGMADFRLLDRKVVDDVTTFEEQGLFLRGIVQWVGYPSTSIQYRAADRFQGTSKYSLYRMTELAWHGVSSFSNVPLRIGVAAGFTASFISFAGIGYAIYGKILSGNAVAGWASSVAIISFLFAILFVYLGILGEYIGQIVTEVRRRPRYLVSERLGLNPESELGD
jgi:dolichol-phosphate mannosyltransferase